MNELLFIAQTLLLSSICLIIAQWHVSVLSVYSSVLCIFANVFVTKQIMLAGWHATPSDALIIASSLSCNLIQEYHGAQAARRALLTSFGACLLYLVLVASYLAYQPSIYDTAQPAAHLLFASSPRIIIASLVSFLVSGLLDYYIFGWLKTTRIAQFLLVRNYISVALCQALDTLLFSFLGLYGLVAHLGHIMLVSYILKCVALLVASLVLMRARTQSRVNQS